MNESIRIRSRSLSAWDQRTGGEPRVVALRAGRRTNVNSPSGRTRRMAELPDERQLVLGRVPSWTGGRRVLGERRTLNCSTATIPFSPEEMQLLDALDSELERQGGDGVWGPISTEFTRRDLEFEYLTRGGLRLPSTDHHRFRPPRRGRPRRRPKSGSTPRSGNTASTSRHSSKHNSTSSFIKTSGTPDQIAFSDRTNLSIVAVSSVTGVTCLEVLFSYSSGVSTLNISGTL